MAPTSDTSMSGSSKAQSQASRSSKPGAEKQAILKQKSPKGEESPDEDSPGPSKGPSSPSGDRREKVPSRSFIIVVENLRPEYSTKQPPQATKQGNWDPPGNREGLSKSHRDIFRWKDGAIETPGQGAPIPSPSGLERHGVASVFPQSSHGQLLVAYVDARVQSVSNTPQGTWRGLGFHHLQRSSSGNSWYSYLDFAASNERTAAFIENDCIPQLLPHIHNETSPIMRKRKHAGLIGRLSLLIAIAALSCPKAYRNIVIRGCIQPGRWGRHNRTPAREEAGHGVVVSIYYDRTYPNASNKQILDGIENGNQGPFYGP